MGILIVEDEINEVESLIVEGKADTPKRYFIQGKFMQSEVKNRNGRIYPRSLLEREANSFNENYIRPNRALGELGHPCFSEDVEVLTTSGWKKISTLSTEEKVYTLNPETKIVEVQNVLQVINEEYSGDIYKLNNRTFSDSVTPDHKYPLIDRNGKVYFLNVEEMYNGLYNPEYSRGEHNKSYIPKRHDTFFEGSGPITLFGYNTQSEDIQVDYDDFVSFLALYLAEGHTKAKKRKNFTYCVSIYQNDGTKAGQIRELITRLPFDFSEVNKNGKITWNCSDPRLGHYLHKFGLHYEKYVDPMVLYSIGTHSAQLFLDWFILGDGRGSRNTKFVKCDAFSTSEQLIDDISYIAFIAGHATRKFSELTENDYKFAGRTIKAENKRPLWFCQFLTTNGSYLDRNSFSIKKEENYVGRIYCIKVPNQTFYVRSNGYTHWTGNCGPAINLDRVSHIIREMKQSGNDFEGKAEILDTPFGKIAKNLMDGGAQLGVSTRGVGTVKQMNGESYVNNDFSLKTVDIVADPSAPDAFVQGIMEGKEWVFADGAWSEREYNNAKKILSEARRTEIESHGIKLFKNYMSKITNR